MDIEFALKHTNSQHEYVEMLIQSIIWQSDGHDILHLQPYDSMLFYSFQHISSS